MRKYSSAFEFYSLRVPLRFLCNVLHILQNRFDRVKCDKMWPFSALCESIFYANLSIKIRKYYRYLLGKVDYSFKLTVPFEKLAVFSVLIYGRTAPCQNRKRLGLWNGTLRACFIETKNGRFLGRYGSRCVFTKLIGTIHAFLIQNRKQQFFGTVAFALKEWNWKRFKINGTRVRTIRKGHGVKFLIGFSTEK